MSFGGLLCGTSTLVVGVEEDPGGLATRVYVGARYLDRYFLISDPDVREACRRTWGGTRGHVIADIEDLRSVGVLIDGARCYPHVVDARDPRRCARCGDPLPVF